MSYHYTMYALLNADIYREPTSQYYHTRLGNSRDLTEYEKRRTADHSLLTAVMLFTDSTSDAVGAPQRRSDVRRPPSCMARVRYCYSLTVGDSALACRAHVQERARFVVWYYLSLAAHQ